MTKSRMTVVAAVAAFALLLIGGAGPAAAQGTGTSQPPALTKVVKMTATAKNGKQFTGTYTIQRFTQSGGKLYAVGTMRFTRKHRTIRRTGVRVPASVAQQQAATTSQAPAIPPTPNACQILSLHLGAIDLNLLGLRVRTNPIDALIEGVRGPGNLLGNLLCAVTGLLDQNALQGPLSQIAAALNSILALLPRTA